jgi:hypothetical protein
MPIVKLFQRKKVQGEKVKVAKNRDDRVHHLTEFGLRVVANTEATEPRVPLG